VRPINILHLRDTHEIGGPGKTILETFRAIDATRFRPHLAVFLTRHEREETPFVMAAREYGMPVHVIRGFNQFDPRMIWRVVALVKQLNIDIISAHEVKSDVIAYLASLLRPTAIVTTLHGWIGNSPKQRLFIALDRLIVRRFDRVIAVSGRIRDEVHAAAVPADKVRLLHNAIVIERYARTGRRGFLAELLGRPVAGPVIASIGRMSPEKGHLDLIEALGIAAARGCRMSAVLVGDGPERQRLVDRIQALGLQESVHLPGYLKQPERVLEETDLAVLPSHTEGLPNAALEALIMEVPVLATRVGGTPEVITDGETGCLVEPRSPEALADALIDFVNDPLRWKQMARRGKLQVESRFNFHSRTRELEAIYAELAPGSRA
jgi:glycosyltransferase involved in cell wall biosynthesis